MLLWAKEPRIRAARLARAGALVVASLSLACGDDGGATNTSASTMTTGTTTTGTTSTTSTTSPTAGTGITTGVGACQGDSFEPNNTIQDATGIGDGELVAVACPGEVDYFAVTVEKTTFLSAILYHSVTDSTVSLDLLKPAGMGIRSAVAHEDVPGYPAHRVHAIHIQLRDPGAYLLRVSHYSGPATPYNLVVQRFVDETPGP